MERRKKRWFKLDNAAKLYPAIAHSRWSSIFRVSAVMTEDVDAACLQKALDLVLPRFPAMMVHIKHGLFWYYFEENDAHLSVVQEEGHPCVPFKFKGNNGYLLRVLYRKKRISVEFFHALTDGTGGMIFLKTLLCTYLCLQGLEVQYDAGALNIADAPKPDEYEDAFQKIPLPKKCASRKEAPSYHLPTTREISHTLNVIAASMPCDAMLNLSRALHVSLTEYLAAVMLYVIYQEQKKEKRLSRPIRVSVPINLRAYYQTNTLRNFSSFVNPEIDARLGDYTFEEIVQTVHAFLLYHNTGKLLGAITAANVRDERNLLVRLCPLPLKNFVIGQVFRASGERLFASTISNLGRITLPTGAAPYVKRMEMMLGAAATPCCQVGMLSSGGQLQLMFTDNIEEKTLPRGVLRFLVERGVPVTVESNQEQEGVNEDGLLRALRRETGRGGDALSLMRNARA